MSKPLSLILAFLAFFLFILLSVTPSLWADQEFNEEFNEELNQTFLNETTDDLSYSDFEAELKSVESGEQFEKNEKKAIEEKEMMADLITDEVQNEQASVQKKTIPEANQETLKTLSEPEKILPSTNSMKKRRVRSR